MKKVPVILLGVTLALASCTGSSEKEKGDSEADSVASDSMSTSTEDSKQQETKVTYSFAMPSPLQIGDIFQNAGLTYMEDLLNPTDKITKYNTKTKKLLNLGVYSSDMSYAVLNEQTQQAKKYMKVVKQLGEDLGMSEIFNAKSMLDRFDNSLNERDSVIQILAELQEDMDFYLEDTEQEHLNTLVFTGAWIEGMYFGVNAIENDDRVDLTTRLIEQMTLMRNVSRGLENYPNPNEEVLSLKSELDDLQKKFDQLLEMKRKQMKQGEKLSFSFTDLKNVGMKIEDIRNQIVN